MTFAGIAVRYAIGSRGRSALTILGVAIGVLAFVTLRTLPQAFTGHLEHIASTRLVTRHKVTYAMTIPKRYVEQIATMPHVEAVTGQVVLRCESPLHEGEWFKGAATFSSFLDVFTHNVVEPAHLTAWEEDRRAALVGTRLAEQLGWSVGDWVTVRSSLFPDGLQFHIVGTYGSTSPSSEQNWFIFRWEYLNDQDTRFRDGVNVINTRVDRPENAAAVSAAIDRHFDSSEYQTLTIDERSDAQEEVAYVGVLLGALDVISATVLITMMLLLGNTIAMGARERIPHYGTMRAMGLPRRSVAFLLALEGALLAAVGALIGIAAAYPLLDAAREALVSLVDLTGRSFIHVEIEPASIVTALVLAIGLAVLSALVPALSVMRLRVADMVRRVG